MKLSNGLRRASGLLVVLLVCALSGCAPTTRVGLMPVDYVPLGDAAAVAGNIGSALDAELATAHRVDLIDADRMGHWSHVLKMSRFDRRELQAGQVTGAELLVLPRLVQRGEGYLLQVRLIDTATGQTRWEQMLAYEGESTIERMIQPLIQEIGRQPRAIARSAVDVGFLEPADALGERRLRPIRSAAMRQRWSGALAAAGPELRVLDGQLAEFVYQEATAQRFGVSDPQRHRSVVRRPIVIESRFELPVDTDDAADGPYRVEMTVHDGPWQEHIEVVGRVSEAGVVEAHALQRVLDVIARRRGVALRVPLPQIGGEDLPVPTSPQRRIYDEQSARQFAYAALAGGELPDSHVLKPLVAAGEGRLALDAAIAWTWKNRHLGGWSYFAILLSHAIDQGDMALAFDIYHAQVELFPGYYADRVLTHQDRLQKLRADNGPERPWSDLLDGLLEDEDLDRHAFTADILQPHRLSPKGQSDYFEWLFDQKQYQAVADQALEALRARTPHDNGPLYSWRPQLAYLNALPHLLDEADYEQRLLEILNGDLPEVAGGWDSSVVARFRAWSFRFEAAERLARLWAERQDYQAILSHPMVGSWAWYQANLGSEWDLYLYAGLPQHAVDAAKYDDEKLKANLYTGRYAQALAYVPEGDRGDYRSYMKAAMLAGDMDAFDRAVKGMGTYTKAQDMPMLIEQVRLLRVEAGAFAAWVDGYGAEHLQDTDAALAAYRACAANYPDSLAGAESLFRLGELTWLGQGDRAAGQAWFDQAAEAYAIVIDRAERASRQRPMRRHGFSIQLDDFVDRRSWALYRVGQIELLTRGQVEAARDAWTQGVDLPGRGGFLCGWALHSLSGTEPTLMVGGQDYARPGRIVNLASAHEAPIVTFRLREEHLSREVQARWVGPIGLDKTLFAAWTDDMKADLWQVYAWYRFHDIRPGFSIVHVKTPSAIETVWCRLHGRDSPKP